MTTSKHPEIIDEVPTLCKETFVQKKSVWPTAVTIGTIILAIAGTAIGLVYNTRERVALIEQSNIIRDKNIETINFKADESLKSINAKLEVLLQTQTTRRGTGGR